MTEVKPWWASRTIWTGLAVAIVSIATILGIAPEWLTQDYVEHVIVAILGLMTVAFRWTSHAEIGTPPTE